MHESPLQTIPSLPVIRERMGQLYRELSLLRRLKRIAEDASEAKSRTASLVKEDAAHA